MIFKMILFFCIFAIIEGKKKSEQLEKLFVGILGRPKQLKGLIKNEQHIGKYYYRISQHSDVDNASHIILVT